MAPDQKAGAAAPTLADLLARERDAIVARFVADVLRTEISPAGLTRSLLADHIPTFLDEIVEELSSVRAVRSSAYATDTSSSARRHGAQRWALDYDLDAIIREYGILRHCILQAARDANVAISIDEFDVFAKCLSVGIAEAATEYARRRDDELSAQKDNLEFLAEAGQLLASSLDYRSTLGRLTRLLVPRMADWCTVDLDGAPHDAMPLAHVDPAKAGRLRELHRRDGDADAAARTDLLFVPDLVAAADAAIAERPEDLALLRELGTVSFLRVPLRVKDDTFGALTLGYSDSQRRYGRQDLVLAGEVAQRAAVAIDNARLYDLSQKERSRVEAATRAKDAFVAMVSHELRTPLNAILGWLQLMRGGALPDEKKQHALDVIERNAKAQSQLVADLLEISRAIEGKIRINPSQVDLANVVDMAIEGVRPAAEAKRIAIETHVDDQSTVMRGDGDRLQQVVWNLLTNAVKFAPKGGKIAVTLGRVDSDLELRVDDDGVGIDRAFLPFVFDSFRQFDSSATRAHGGLGIGLSIAKHIVELHGGSIEAESRGLGAGASFVVRLPLSPVVSTTLGVTRVSATKGQSPAEALSRGHEGIRVLVVDDEPDARELVAFVLETAGMDVRIAPSAAAAMAELERYTPHVIVSDIGMPDEDGYMLIRRIRTMAAEDKRSTAAIALTAFARNEDRTRALVEGFNLHMSKPVEPTALVKAVVDLAGNAAP